MARSHRHPAQHLSTARSEPDRPWTIDVRTLSRQPGHMRRLTLTVPAPADLGTEVLSAATGSPVSIEARLETVAEGIVATGTVTADLEGECVRCLAPVSLRPDADFQELYVYPESEAEDDEALRLDGDLLDLEQAVRDALVLDLPFQPLCSPQCPGLCPQCGQRLADDPGHTHDAAIDPRWAALQGLGAEPEAAAGDPTPD